MNISDIAIKRPVFTTMVTLSMMVLGLVGMTSLGVDLFPDVSFPIVVVTTPYPGASPEEVEQLVTKPIEEAVASINGVDKLKSTSRDSMSTVIILFKLETPIKEAAVDVRDKLSTVRGKLPRDILEPVISRVDPSAMPIITYTVATKRSSFETRNVVDNMIKPSLEQVKGVASVLVRGGDIREIQVDLDGNRMEALKLSPFHVAQALGKSNINIPAGRLNNGKSEVSIRTMGQFKSLDEIGNTVVAARDGNLFRISDIGRVVDSVEERRLRTRMNGIDSVVIAIQKNSGENTVAVVDLVKAKLEKIKGTLPSDVQITKIVDSSDFIKENLHEVTVAIVFGGLMAILIIYVFMLDWRSTLISALALPTSVIATFFVLYLFGFTINMMTLMALSLAIGLLIDDAVVVRENIYRHMEMGEDPFTAASKGTQEIALAVMATTFTVVAVFVPVAFSKGMIGQFFKQFGITVAAAVLVSLFVAFTLDPMLSARLVKPFDPDHEKKSLAHPILGKFLRFYDGMDRTYREILAWSLNRRKTVIFTAVAMFIGSCGLTGIMGKEFTAAEDRGQFTVTLELPAETSIDETDRVTRIAEKMLAQNKDFTSLYAVVGSPNDSGNPLEANTSTIRILAVDKRQRKASLEDLKKFVRIQMSQIPGVKYSIADMQFVEGMAEPPILLNIRGDDYSELQRISHEAIAIAQKIPGITEVSSTFVPGKPEYQVKLNRDVAADLGVDTATVGMYMRALIEGDTSNKFREGENEYNIRVRMQPEQRAEKFHLLNQGMPSNQLRPVYLHEFAEIVPGSGPSAIEREARRRQISVSIYVGGRSLGDVLGDLQKQMAKIQMGPTYQVTYGGMAERMSESFGNLGLALGLAIIFIYFVLASQFESFIHPFTIMVSLPLAIVGAFTLLFLSGLNLGMPAMIGVVLLMGLVTKNAILLVDYTNQLREERGMGIMEALLEAGPTRLRPILMTSAAMVLGMLPTALSNGPGSEFRQPMSIAVIGGVIASTFLTLVVVPVVYTWVDRFSIKKKAIQVAHESGSTGI